MQAVVLDDPGARSAPVTLRALHDAHYDFVWRSLRRLGLPGDRCEDAAQQVFLVASRKREHIVDGNERAFLYGIALRVASDIRRSAAYRREVPQAEFFDASDMAGPEEIADQRRAREMLDRVLAGMPLDVRAVFVAYEIEEWTIPEIAASLDIPVGTVSSRLRRGRELFEVAVKRIKDRGGAG
jgi:RNA polymerase sigma-70 factor (ECF subfamily)